MPVVNKPFNSQFGFSSPNFSVDDQGNIVATSIQAAGAGGGGARAGVCGAGGVCAAVNQV